MTPPLWKIKATTLDGGFSLSLIGDGDLGEALDADNVVVEMEDGRRLGLYQAVSELIQGRVTTFVVMTEQLAQQGIVLPTLTSDCQATESAH